MVTIVAEARTSSRQNERGHKTTGVRLIGAKAERQVIRCERQALLLSSTRTKLLKKGKRQAHVEHICVACFEGRLKVITRPTAAVASAGMRPHMLVARHSGLAGQPCPPGPANTHRKVVHPRSSPIKGALGPRPVDCWHWTATRVAQRTYRLCGVGSPLVKNRQRLVAHNGWRDRQGTPSVEVHVERSREAHDWTQRRGAHVRRPESVPRRSTADRSWGARVPARQRRWLR